MNTFQTQASDLLKITANRNSTFIDGNLIVFGQITGSTGGATGGTGDLTVNRLSVKTGMGCTGTAEFFSQIVGNSFIFGITPYAFISVNNPNTVYTTVSNGGSIIEAMRTSGTVNQNGLTITPSGGNAYIEPIAKGIYEMSFFARLKDGDEGQVNGVIPYIYPRGSTPTSWIISTNEPQFIGSVFGSRCSIEYKQTIVIPSASDTRIDLRASVQSGTLNIAFGTFTMKYISSL
jgi:hypothetical protein